MGWGMTAKGYSGMPQARAIARAVPVNPSVMMAAAGAPAFSMDMASCKLLDEQLPQSPTAESTASQPASSASMAGAAGAFWFGLRRRSTSRTSYRVRRMSST